MVMHGKGKCSICGLEKDIVAKVPNGGEILYCKQCFDNEIGSMLDNFNKINLVCLKCGSPNIQKDDPKAGINETDIINGIYANVALICNECNLRFFVNVSDYGQT